MINNLQVRYFFQKFWSKLAVVSAVFNPEENPFGFLLVLFIIVQLISQTIPPFQSPDEFNHIKRAYLLAKGEVFLSQIDNSGTGGRIDAGLLKYMEFYSNLPFHPDRKVSEEMEKLSKTIEWEGKRQFSGLPNTAIYFPLSYLPQSLALLIGEKTNLSVHNSYQLARFFSLAAALGLVFIAYLAYPIPIMVYVLLITPMSLFQLGSASLDAVSFALSILIAALFLRGSDLSKSFSSFMYGGLIVSLIIFTTTRINFLPLALLSVLLYLRRRNKLFLIASVISVVLIISWIVYSLLMINAMPVRQLSTIEIIIFYIKNPAQLVNVFISTFTDTSLMKNYVDMFIGNLGWLDTPLKKNVFNYVAVLLLIELGVTANKKLLRSNGIGAVSLFTLSLLSGLFLFLIMLVSWTKHPAVIIEGVQGRYFTPIFIFIIFSFFGLQIRDLKKIISSIVLTMLLLVSGTSTVNALLDRYYLSSDPLEFPKISNNTAGNHFGELTSNRSFEQTFIAEGSSILSIKLFLATFARRNTGEVTLEIVDSKGITLFKAKKTLKKIKYNSWAYFLTDRLSVLKDEKYILRLTSTTGAPGNAITWWASPHDTYLHGHAIVDSVDQQADFAFEVVFSK